MIGKRVQKAAVTAALVVVSGLSIGASMDTPGAKVAVREGDLWTGVTVVRKEGSETLIRYDDEGEEWVGSDRLREVVVAPDSASTTRPAAAAKSWLSVGSKVERKDFWGWHPGKMMHSQRGWYLVKDQRTHNLYWCEPWLLRAPGSAYSVKLSHQDFHRRLAITPIFEEHEPAPAEAPGPCPGGISSVSQDAPSAPKVEVREGEQWTRATLLSKEGSETLIRYDDDAEEWVSNDRLRQVSGPPGPASTTQPAATAKSWLTVGYYVEHRDYTDWHLGKILDSQRGWYLVGSGTRSPRDWYEPWMLRAPGSAYDIEYGNQAYHRRMWVPMPGPAPAEAPGPSPRRFGNAPQDVPGPLPAPPVTPLDLGAAADSQPGTMTPLNLATTRPTKGFRSATIGGRDGVYFGPRAKSAALCRDTPGIVVFGHVWVTGSDVQEVIRFDSNTGRTIGRYPLSIRSHYIAGAADSGKVLLTLGGSGLCLWELHGHTYQITAEYETGPYHAIRSACLTDATHAVVRDSDNNCFYIDLKESRAIGKIRVAAGTEIYVDPTGQILAAITTDNWWSMRGGKAVLIHLSDFSTIAEFPGAAHKGNVAIDPAGELIAFFSDDGPVRVIRLADGSVVANIPVTLQVPGELDLTGEGFLLVDHRYVFDIQTGIPLWIYNRPATGGSGGPGAATGCGTVRGSFVRQ